MRSRQLLGGMVLAAALLPAAVAAQDNKPYVNVRALNAALAGKAVNAALAHCEKSGYQVAVALVDRGGNLQAFTRNPLAGTHTIGVSQAKARTAASFQSTTLELMTNPRLGQLNYAEGVLLIGGGVPIRIGGQFYGAIGVSGAPAEKLSGDVDEVCANAGIAAIREEVEFAE